MASTAFPTLVTNIVTAFKAAASLSDVVIYDGIEIDETFPGDFIAVGHNGAEEGDVEAVSIRQEYDQLGAKKMFEDGLINCVLVTNDGTSDIAARRTRAFAILSAVDTVIRTDPSFSSACLYSGIETHSTEYRLTNAGSAVVINFTIAYRART